MTGAAHAIAIDGTEPLSPATVHAVEAVCDRVGERGSAGVLSAEVSGAPTGSWTAGAHLDLVTRWERAVRRFERLGIATVALLSGDVGGAALDVLLATDVRVASPDTRLHLQVDGAATWPGMAAYRLVQQAGVAPVRPTVLFGYPIEVAEAAALGLVHEVTDDPSGALARLAWAAAELSGRELAIRRRLMDDDAVTSFEEALGAHLAACDRMLRQAASGAGP